ncbi:glycerol transporter [Physocladia obscura]|uniref:Glycerol transporter n=1 Tax=Physocladia obscura TaxID=109957 RepID=A0AAD5TB68_9FUNG|nr:glycerol transporter [Physocladia obscura]
MVSFDMDFHWKCCDGGASEEKVKLQSHLDSCKECGKNGPNNYCARARIETSLDINDYNIISYFTYILYIPLYLAGPIITFNDFINQLKTRPAATKNRKLVFNYVVRWIICFFLMELFIHSTFVIAIAKSSIWKQYFSSFQVACLGYFNLKHIWLKLLVIWRFFRAWAMMDGIETIENMNRCMSNNYSASGFWRSWHRSFNRWIIRYIYVPMGGSRMYLVNLFVTFTFVAIWHDLNLNLLLWGWLISLSIIPETIAMKAIPHKRWESWRHYKHLCGVGAVANILLMIAVNIVGFGAAGGHENSADGGVMAMIPIIFNINS